MTTSKPYQPVTRKRRFVCPERGCGQTFVSKALMQVHLYAVSHKSRSRERGDEK